MTFSLNPTYYQVTWTANGPTNYMGLTGTANGGLDPVTAWGINRLISVTGSSPVTGTPMADGETILINDYTISFLSTDNLASIISKINLAAKFTGVVADQSVAGTYLTLMNAPGKEGYPFSLAEGNGTALAGKLKINPGAYSYYPGEVGTAFTSVTADSNITINGVNIVFASGGLASAASQISTVSEYTGVAASVAGPYLQISAVSGQSWSINSGNAVSNLGTTLGNHGGYPKTIAFSQAKERANMRWSQMVSELEENATPILLSNITRTGNISNIETTSVTFTVGYDRPDTVYTVARPGEPDAGNLLVGASAVKRAVARALTSVITGNRKLFDPTLHSYGAYCDRPNAARIQQITATGLDTVENVTIVEDNLTVIQIAGV